MTDTQNTEQQAPSETATGTAQRLARYWAKELLTKKAMLIAGIAFFSMYLQTMIHEYLDQTRRLDEAARQSFNLAPSSEFSFFQVLRLAHFPYWTVAFAYLIAVFIPALLLVWLFRRCITREPHLGWRRLGIGLLATAIAFRGYVADSFEGFIVASLISCIALLSLLLLVRWIITGFKAGQLQS